MFEADNYDLLKSEYLKIDYNYSTWAATTEAIKLNNASELIKSIKCSAEAKDYPIANLFDGNSKTCYVSVNDNSGNNWIEIEFEDSVAIYGMGIINGYPKSKDTYFNNRIATKIKITLYNVDGEENNRELYEDFKRKPMTSDFSLNFGGIEDLIFGDIIIPRDDWDYIKDNSFFKKMKIEIIESDTGEKYNDICLSEIMLYGIKY